MDNRRLIVAVWKEKLTYRQSIAAATAVRASTEGERWPFEIVLAPNPFSYVGVAECTRDSHAKLCAQNILWHPESGSYIGETTAAMLCEVGCDYVIVGHSERRGYFGESNDMIARRALAAVDAGITPILCFGDTAEEKESGRSKQVILAQLRAFFDRVPHDLDPHFFVLAYEPVWAISTWRTERPLPSGAEVQRLHQYIRTLLAEIRSDDYARRVTLVYGGSVAPDNATDYMQQPDVDGALVGGASKTPASFVGTLRAARAGFEAR